jgi:histidine triad (HIT) family protein
MSNEKRTEEAGRDLPDCVFCERIEDGRFTPTDEASVVRFAPLNPVVPGHMLFLPAGHVDDAAERPWITGLVFEQASAYAHRAEEEFNLITSAGPLATQSVWHLHVHYVPRREGDGLPLPWTGQVRKSAATSSVHLSTAGLGLGDQT